ncbi:hypothetical protein D9615_010358 [Tricholomella constricta]|uniref:Uncharacterized protein n=1 Tax=Tricholomella constricta TaxID=117010 RepID=A0A8H5LST4_9AGAR|nr:hypothetical protein D9615_010358 [Tricholomella constricta]
MSQMQSLGQAMQTLTPPSSSPRVQPPPQTANTAHSEMVPLPLPPCISITKGRRCFYGFDVPKEWFINYFDQNHHRIRNYDPNTGAFTKWYMTMILLENLTRCRNLSVESVTYKISDPTTLFDPEKGYVYLVSMCSTMRNSYYRRPNQRQVNILKDIFGREPEWYVDFHDASFYED